MNQKVRAIIGIISCLMLVFFAVYRLTVDTASILIPVLIGIGGFIGFIGGILELMRIRKG